MHTQFHRLKDPLISVYTEKRMHTYTYGRLFFLCIFVASQKFCVFISYTPLGNHFNLIIFLQ